MISEYSMLEQVSETKVTSGLESSKTNESNPEVTLAQMSKKETNASYIGHNDSRGCQNEWVPVQSKREKRHMSYQQNKTSSLTSK